MDKLDMSLWKILRVSQLSWTNRSRSDLSGREGLSSLQVQQSIWTQKEWWRGLFVICTECATDSSCVCHLASWHYHQSKVFLDLARILEVAACTLLPHDPYFVPKNWVKKGEIGHTLGPMCIQGECNFSEHFRFKYLIMTHTSCTQRASNVFWPMWNVQIWKSFEKTCCCVYQRMPTIRRRTLERLGMQVQQRWLNMRAGKHLKWVEQPASAYISTWTLGRVCI